MQEKDKTYILEGSYLFYNAPVVILIILPQFFYPTKLIDIGMAAQNLMLSAYGRGLGTCPIALVLSFEDIIREELEIPTDMRIVLTIALGYPDQDAEVNKFRSSRENLSEFITWIGY